MVAGLSVSALALVLTLAPQAATITAESERYLVEALDSGSGDRPARVIVSDQVTSRKHMVMVNSTLGELTRAVIRDDQQRVTLVCRKGFAVLDPAGVASTDEVYGLDATVSPGGRWIAYRRFFPSTHPGPSDGIVVYDTKQSREENHAAYPIAVEREWRAGLAIYPPTDQWKDANAAIGEEQAYRLTSPVTWEGNRDDAALLFSMRSGTEDVVVVAAMQEELPRTCWSILPGGADRWRVKTLTYSRSGDARIVSAASSAQDAAETTIRFGAECSGEVRRTPPASPGS